MKIPKIALIHATGLAVDPIHQAFASLWKDAQCVNLLDDSLTRDLQQMGGLTPALTDRFVALARYAKSLGSQGILFTCSAFGPAIDKVKHEIGLPTLKPNEAMYDEALALCHGVQDRPARIGLVTTFAPATMPMLEELTQAIKVSDLQIKVESKCVTGAMEMLNSGDAVLHDRMIVEAIADMPVCDVYLLGQFSMARAQADVSAMLNNKAVLTSPTSAVRRMKLEIERLI